MLKKEINNIELSIETPYEIQLVNIPAGIYRLRIIHQSRAVFDRPKSLFFTFDMPGASNDTIKNTFNLKWISEKYGPFVYLEQAESNNEFYIQEVILEIKNNISLTNIKLHTFVNNVTLQINSLQIYLISLDTNDAFFEKHSISDSKKLIKSEEKKPYKLEKEAFKEEQEKNKYFIFDLNNFILINDHKINVSVGGSNQIKILFSLENEGDEILENNSLVSIKYINNENDSLLPEGFGINPHLGAYQYCISGPAGSPQENEIIIDIPPRENINSIELTFKAWGRNYINTYLKKDTFRVERSSISEVVDGGSSLNKFIDSLKSADRLIMIYTTAPFIGHETLELRPNRLTKEYIKLGYKVIFFAFSRVPEELKLPKEYNNLLLQCHKDELLNCVSLVSSLEIKEKIFICSSFPDIHAMVTIERFKLSQDWKLVYEIRDDMEEFNRVGYSKWYSTQLEINVARKVDKIITVSPRLAQKIKIMSKANPLTAWDEKVKVIQNAAPDTLIEKSKYLRNSRFFEKKTNSTIIGYIGHLTPAWFDWPLLFRAAKDFPELQFEIIGHGMPDKLDLPENISYLGPKNHDEFLMISERWKVGLIPFISSPLTYGVDPNKIYEYLAANLLVITAEMGAVRECPATYVYTNYREFKKCLSEALKVQYDNALLHDIESYVFGSHWSDRAKAMIEFIGDGER